MTIVVLVIRYLDILDIHEDYFLIRYGTVLMFSKILKIINSCFVRENL